MFLRDNKLEWNLQLILLVKVWHLVRKGVFGGNGLRRWIVNLEMGEAQMAVVGDKDGGARVSHLGEFAFYLRVVEQPCKIIQ